MNDHVNGAALQSLAAALAPYLVAELAKHNGTGGNPAVQNPAQNGSQFGGQAPVQQQYNPQAPVQQQQYNPQGTQQQYQAPVQNGQAQVTPEMIQSLIVPLISNETTKGLLAAQMQQMGIQNLHEARPDQLPELYARFQSVAAQSGGAQQPQNQFGGAPQGQYQQQPQGQYQQPQGNPQQGGAPSII